MARLKELKEKYPLMGKSVIDLLSEMDKSKTNKFVPIMLKIIEKKQLELIRYNKNDFREMEYIKNSVISFFNLDESLVSDDYIVRLLPFKNLFSNFMDREESNTFHDFMKFHEKNIINCDVNKVESFEDMFNEVLKASTKELEKLEAVNVHVEYRDDTWLLIRPLTFESSLKYGASTRWCTASRNDSQTFFEYTQSGVLLYLINFTNGEKYGIYCRLTNDYEDDYILAPGESHQSYSFWNSADQRIDSMFIDMSNDVINVIKNIKKIPNKNLDEVAWKKSYEKYQTPKGLSIGLDVSYEGLAQEDPPTHLNETVVETKSFEIEY